jgi:hypothetical protein
MNMKTRFQQPIAGIPLNLNFSWGLLETGAHLLTATSAIGAAPQIIPVVSFQQSDPDWTNYPTRFYRLRSP